MTHVEMVPEMRVCPVCDVTFELHYRAHAPGRRRVTCSEDCRREMLRRSRRKYAAKALRLPSPQQTMRTAGEAVVDLVGELLEAGVPLLSVVDQLVTYAALASIDQLGAQETSARFRQVADKIAGGEFDRREVLN